MLEVMHALRPASAAHGLLCISNGRLAVIAVVQGRHRPVMRHRHTGCVSVATPLPMAHGDAALSPPRIGNHGAAHPAPFFWVWFVLRLVSDQAARGHRYRFAVADHQMVEHAHADQLQRLTQFAGDRAVGGTGFGHAGGVLGCIRGCQHCCSICQVVEHWDLLNGYKPLPKMSS